MNAEAPAIAPNQLINQPEADDPGRLERARKHVGNFVVRIMADEKVQTSLKEGAAHISDEAGITKQQKVPHESNWKDKIPFRKKPEVPTETVINKRGVAAAMVAPEATLVAAGEAAVEAGADVSLNVLKATGNSVLESISDKAAANQQAKAAEQAPVVQAAEQTVAATPLAPETPQTATDFENAAAASMDGNAAANAEQVPVQPGQPGQGPDTHEFQLKA